MSDDNNRATIVVCSGDMDKGVVDIVAPDPHVHVRAFAFDGIVPAVRDDVAVNVRVTVGASLETVVGAAADPVIESVVVRGPDRVIAEDVSAL